MSHSQPHRQNRVGWLRAAVLGANDGIVSTASLIIGVASANSSHISIVVAGTAGLVAGAISMAAGEYVSVCAQADTEKADLLLEKQSLESDYESEVIELAKIYQQRGVEQALSVTVAQQLMAHDALGAHARDDIGISELTSANPLSAAFASALSFTLGAVLPLLTAYFYSADNLSLIIALLSLVFLAMLGAVSAYLSGAKIITGVARVTFWGSLAMVATALVGLAFNVTIR
ncbi:VIT family protein [Paraglaciecola sp. L1A13]|uniref:VIT1/CCC1 transporter family protein n=1 Tax=Paraglaciecola sp. L1A13 TaxID=2686359 RepID=UPI00131D1EC9|nr:VIT family protein [Paraglaciecola sp. L1A13]|tara:strand:+ start:594 stop:1286 length:693 start_codon:yes stop_codon:yes gene_type:complete